MQMDIDLQNQKQKVSKTKEERVSDAIKILTKLLEYGIEKESTQYIYTKTHLDGWIKTGEPQFHKIYFPSHGRTAHMTLPEHSGVEPIYVLKARERRTC